MNAAIKAGGALAVAVFLLNMVWVGSGQHQSFPVGPLIFIALAIALNIAAVYWGLSGSAGQAGYGGQLLNALIIGLVGGVLIFVGSWLTLGMIFTDALDQTKDAQIAFLEGMQMPEEVLQQQVEAVQGVTVFGQAINGAIGTVVTSVVIGAIVAIFKRRK